MTLPDDPFAKEATTAPESVYSVVIPVYGNAESLPEVVRSLEWLDDQISARVEAVFVIDGSPDDSEAVLTSLLPEARVEARLVCHARNFGSFAAIRTGMEVACGDLIAVMAADLQEPIELVAEFHKELSTGDYDIAVGRRVGRDDPAVSKAMSGLYWRGYRRMVEPQMPVGGVDVFACSREVAAHLGSLEESHSSLVGQLYWLGFRRVEVPYERREREHGSSGWSFRKKLDYLLDSVFSFTNLPISLILMVGVVGTGAAFLGAVVVFTAWAMGAIQVAGYTALMLVLLLSTGSILSALGIVGTYVWRAYENTKHRPSAVVRQYVRHYSQSQIPADRLREERTR